MALPTPYNVPVENLPNLYTNNMVISYATTTTLSISSGQKRDSTNTVDMATSTATTLNFARNGVNGLDFGSIGASACYYIYAISDSTNKQRPGFLASLSATSPIMPYNYDAASLDGVWFTSAGSVLVPGYMVGIGSMRKHYYDPILQVLNDGTASSLTNIALTAVVPPIDNTLVNIYAAFTPATANDHVDFAPGGSSSTVLPGLYGSVAAKINSGEFEILSKLVSSVPTIRYINSAASGNTDVFVKGFTYFV